MKKRLSIVVIAACLLSPAAEASTVGGIRLPLTRDEFRLQGAGLLRKGFFFKIYVGALYVADTGHVKDILGPVPKRIDIHYFHYTPKKYMIRAADDTLRKNLTREEYERFSPQIRLLHDAYLDGQKGACASLVYRPGKGLSYLFEDQPVISIEDDAFANAYFNVWLGQDPSSRTIKEAMLGVDGD